MSFARQVLTRSCPSLTADFREELLTTLSLRTDEAHAVNNIIKTWGEEPNARMTREDRECELRGRIMSWLRARRVVAALTAEVLS